MSYSGPADKGAWAGSMYTYLWGCIRVAAELLDMIYYLFRHYHISAHQRRSITEARDGTRRVHLGGINPPQVRHTVDIG
ncbi:hypothetical protein ACTWPB_14585 [Nocardia sp. IBHARD005]|uniref:hypothetical protein n=1 Tax=Nocardia sp. IBHARD005 TaxID=3457765 RepID=UPI004059FB95